MYVCMYDVIIHKLANGQMKVLVTQLCLTLSNSMGCSLPDSTVLKFSRQEYWSGLPCPPLGDLLDPGIKPKSLALQANSLQFEVTGKPRRPKSKLFCLLCLSLKNSLMSKILFAKNILTFFFCNILLDLEQS